MDRINTGSNWLGLPKWKSQKL